MSDGSTGTVVVVPLVPPRFLEVPIMLLPSLVNWCMEYGVVLTYSHTYLYSVDLLASILHEYLLVELHHSITIDSLIGKKRGNKPKFPR